MIGEGGVAVENWTFPEANPLNKTRIMNLSNLNQFQDLFFRHLKFKSIDEASFSGSCSQLPLHRTTEHPTCFVETASAAAFAASAAFAGFAASAEYFAVYFAAAIAGSIAGSAASSASASSETTVAYAVATAPLSQSGALPWALAQQADNTAEDYHPGKSQDLAAPSSEKSSKYKVRKILVYYHLLPCKSRTDIA